MRADTDDGQTNLGFRMGWIGASLPLLTFVVGVGWLGFSGAPDERGFWPVLIGALGVGLLTARQPSAYATAVTRGMGRPLVMLMVMAWLLAGIFAVLLRESGFVHSLVWVAGELGVGGAGFVVASFAIAMLFSTATGTSLGTILICAPLLYPAAGLLQADPTLLIGAILAGATFGDNVSPVSDTTIASASTQDADMAGVVASRLRYAIPAALLALIVFGLIGGTGEAVERVTDRISGGAHPANLSGDPVALPMLLAPIVTFAMLWRRRGLVESLFAGVVAAVVAGLAFGLIGPGDLLGIDTEAFRASGLILDGMEGAVGIVVFTILLMGLIGGFQSSGVLDRLLERATTGDTGPRQTEVRIFGVTSLAVLLTTHSVVAILAVGDMVGRMGERAGIGRYRRANLLDTTVCTYPFLLPFFIPTILAASATASGEAFGVPRVGAMEAGLANIYSWGLLAVIGFAIATGWGRGERSSPSNAATEDEG